MVKLKQVLRRFLSLSLVIVLTLTLLPQISFTVQAAASGELNGLNSNDIGARYSATDDGSNASWSANGYTITGSVISKSGMCSDSHYETTLTLTNEKSVAAILSFDYTIAQNSGKIQVAGTEVTANGSYSNELAAGASINIYLKSGSTSAATSILIKNLTLLVDVDATTTFQKAENGSYTVDDVEITADISKTQRSTLSYTLKAIPASGYKFLGWYSVSENKYLSSDEFATLNFDSNQTVTARFTEESNPVFDVSGAKFTDLNEADMYASASSLSKITLVSDGTLNSGSYTISSGVTLLIPFDAAGTCYTTAPATTGNIRSAPSVYRKLTMAEGATITVNGAISVSAKHYAYGQNGAGAPDGKYGYIYMNTGSKITVSKGGSMYVYGFVSGDGTVTAESGATVYENMQICDFRGGTTTSGMNNNAQKIFPLNQYFIQNIEAELILESGSDEYIYTSIYAANTSTSTAVHFIGNSGAMFSVDAGGFFTKKYLPDKDRIEISVNGDAKINNLTLTLNGMSVSSGNYVLPINNCMTLNVNSGTTQITQDVALLAGAQVNIKNGATLQVTNDSSLYVYDTDEWTQANYASNAKFKTVLYSPTRTYNRKVSDLVDARIDVNGTLQSAGYVYTTAGGADITSSEGSGRFILINGAGSETATYMYKDYTTNYDTIPITSAKLHNGSQYSGTEEEYSTTEGSAEDSTYNWNTADSKWKIEKGDDTLTIIFNGNGSDDNMKNQTIKIDEDTALETNTFTRDGYTFAGWNTAADGTGTAYDDKAIVNLSEDITLYAQWIPNTYTVTWVDEDGTVLETDENVDYGTTPEYNSENPTKEGDAQYSYIFKGWTPEVGAVTADVTYKAVYEQTVNQYTITWKNWDGTELQSEQVNYGEVPAYAGETPTRDSDAEHTYSFSGWTPEITPVTGNAEYIAAFTDEINTYTVTWVNWNNTELEKDQNVAYGTTPEYNGAPPTREGDAHYSYTFKGWSPAVDTVTGDITYTAVYEQTVNQYTITWKNADDTLYTEHVDYGEIPVYVGETPTKAGNSQYSYAFKGWTPEITAVTSDATYSAEFEQTVNTYTVTWVNADGTKLETDENVIYGTKPEYNGAPPTKDADNQGSYTFKGWTPEITDETMVTGNITYTAVYETVANTYTITWVDADGTELEKDENVVYGAIPEYNGAIPSKAADSENSYTFNGWEPEVTAVTGNATYKAVYTATPIIKYTVAFDANGGEGTMEPQIFVQGEDTKLNDCKFARDNYKFTGWNTSPDGSGTSYADQGALICLGEDITLYAQWQIWSGWFTDDKGTTYYQNGVMEYKNEWADIDQQTYYFDENGYIVKGIQKLIKDGIKARYVFDGNGIFQSDKSGLYDVGEDTYWIENGTIVEEAGLKRVEKENGEINYYYFATQKNVEENPKLEVSKAVKNLLPAGSRDCWIHKTNDLPLPEWGYYFDENGVILHDADTSKNGILSEESILYYYVDGIKAPAGLIKIDQDYYYVDSKGKLVVDQTYYCSRTNGLMTEGTYAFDNNGKLIIGATDKNGIVEENGSLYYYKDGKLTYAGLIQIDGDYYYVRSNSEVVHSQTYYVTWTHDLMEAGYYTFADDGKLIGAAETPKNGVYEENGSLYYYRNDEVTYAGLIQIDGDYYYVCSNGEVVHGQTYYITWTHDLMEAGYYTFADDGKLIGAAEIPKNGIYEENGSLYYYRNGKVTYGGLIQIDGDYYYVRSNGEVVHGQNYYITWTHDLMPQGYYTFDSMGKMILDSESK